MTEKRVNGLSQDEGRPELADILRDGLIVPGTQATDQGTGRCPGPVSGSGD